MMLLSTGFKALAFSMLLVADVSALGINCRSGQPGGYCQYFDGDPYGEPFADCSGTRDTMRRLRCVIQRADPQRKYHDGEKIACLRGDIAFGHPTDGSTNEGAVCVWPERSNQVDGIVGWKLGSLMQDLVEHGCRGCGSIPQGYHWGDNNPKDGILKVDFVQGFSECKFLF